MFGLAVSWLVAWSVVSFSFGSMVFFGLTVHSFVSIFLSSWLLGVI